MQLYYQSFLEYHDANSSVPVIIIPGLFGQSTNWKGFAKKLSVRHPVFVIDQRNHGRSPHASSNSYADMADDLSHFIEQLEFTKVHLCGHSMGGKVAMIFAHLNPSIIDKLVILDIAPVHYQHSHASFVEAMINIDLQQLKSRSEADRLLQNAIPETGVRLFLLQSLIGKPGEYSWRLNLPVLHEYMSEITGFPNKLLDGQTYDGQTLLLSGANSDYVNSESVKTMLKYFPSCRHTTINDAGHWLHAEQPDLVISKIIDFLEKNKFSDQ